MSATTHGKIKVLFLCTGNSARSQMAEAWLRHLGGDRYVALSAGIEPKGINPYTHRVMAEAGVSLAGQRSKDVQAFVCRSDLDYLITVCGHADANCPRALLDVTHRLHWDLDDPAAAAGDDATKLAAFRHTRDEIAARVAAWLAEQG